MPTTNSGSATSVSSGRRRAPLTCTMPAAAASAEPLARIMWPKKAPANSASTRLMKPNPPSTRWRNGTPKSPISAETTATTMKESGTGARNAKCSRRNSAIATAKIVPGCRPNSIPSPLQSWSRFGRPVNGPVVTRDWQRSGVEWQAPFERQAPQVDDMQDRRALGCEPHRKARRAVAAGRSLARKAGRQLVRFAAGAKPDQRAADVDHEACARVASCGVDAREQLIDQSRDRPHLDDGHASA